MPPKNGFTNSVNPELYAKSQKPASTIAMGMKNSQASSQCWANQVAREQAIRTKWAAQYDPESRQEAEATAALERTLARDAARHDAYVNPSTNPEIHELLYKKKPPTTTTTPAASVEQTATSTLTSTTQKAGEERRAAVNEGKGEGSSVAAAEKAGSRRVRRAAEEYLEARCDHHTLQERYPDGPKTAAQSVGWAAATTKANDPATAAMLSRAAPLRRPAGAYRKPEDEEHAALLGFDYTPK